MIFPSFFCVFPYPTSRPQKDDLDMGEYMFACISVIIIMVYLRLRRAASEVVDILAFVVLVLLFRGLDAAVSVQISKNLVR
jgi:hypothetical protein